MSSSVVNDLKKRGGGHRSGFHRLPAAGIRDPFKWRLFRDTERLVFIRTADFKTSSCELPANRKRHPTSSLNLEIFKKSMFLKKGNGAQKRRSGTKSNREKPRNP